MENYDIISTMPDHILSHIMSFLPTKFAISTTILSKRWASPYKSLTSLNFNDESVDNEDAFLRFCRFVDKVTFYHPLIKTFILECSSKHWENGFHVQHLISGEKRHHVENLQISCISLSISNVERWIQLTTSIFIFPNLVVLKLTYCHVLGNIDFNLPALKTLHLNDVHFKNNYEFNKLIYGCAILEDLIANIYYIGQVQDDTVSRREFETLSKLITADINPLDLPFGAITNVETLKLKVLDINLYSGEFSVFQNLINLELYFHTFPHWDCVVELLQNCPNLQVLTIEKWEDECNQDLVTKWKDPSHVPKCISSHLRSCTLICQPFVDELRFAKYVLHNAPHLEVMDISITDKLVPLSLRVLEEELNSVLAISPKCKFSISLKDIGL
ncbi:putative F-box domain, FBD domain, leucine-rich repeat domain, L domain-containing protein [Medicago truncatula]|uniref:F-box/RNI/FBD-like domain protein n=1 Tax=Medicago truncatula TaxID=3880 RepID=G7JZQ8_MEDTR|nr:F-box/FBD/LRR-repeat protein At4g00160-like [Medicago truncatula]AES98834.1 F-box/RNI/FBD-like domain protein [Medicago truncatula]RHN56645.1 putative F-box domain, FBD domain, leucine-rich repeat domain, L domain-containing protein [Medicago truncatula]